MAWIAAGWTCQHPCPQRPLALPLAWPLRIRPEGLGVGVSLMGWRAGCFLRLRFAGPRGGPRAWWHALRQALLPHHCPSVRSPSPWRGFEELGDYGLLPLSTRSSCLGEALGSCGTGCSGIVLLKPRSPGPARLSPWPGFFVLTPQGKLFVQFSNNKIKK